MTRTARKSSSSSSKSKNLHPNARTLRDLTPLDFTYFNIDRFFPAPIFDYLIMQEMLVDPCTLDTQPGFEHQWVQEIEEGFECAVPSDEDVQMKSKSGATKKIIKGTFQACMIILFLGRHAHASRTLQDHRPLVTTPAQVPNSSEALLKTVLNNMQSEPKEGKEDILKASEFMYTCPRFHFRIPPHVAGSSSTCKRNWPGPGEGPQESQA